MHRFQLDRQGDTLVLTSRVNAGGLGALVIIFGIAWLFLAWTSELNGGPGHYAVAVIVHYAIAVIGSIIFGAMLFLALPHEVTTVFDLRSRSALRTRSLAAGLYRRCGTYGFAGIAGLGIKEYGNGGSYRPVMTLRTGETLLLSTIALGDNGYLSYAKTIADVCAAIGLPQVNAPSTHRSPALQLDRRGDSLVVTSMARTGWVAALVIASLYACILSAWSGPVGRLTVFDYYVFLLFGAAFVGLAIYNAVPHEVTTVFDLRARSVLLTRRIGGGWFEGRRTYSFAEIAGLGLGEYHHRDGYSYRPVMTLRSGETLDLGPSTSSGGGYLSYAKTIADVRAATGLPQGDVPYRPWWKR
jgi:hypothetical protein